MTTAPARLAVLLARAAPRAVILRRGPAEWVRCIGWDTATDRFELGQWLHAQVYPAKCDLSPDGSLLVYFTAKYGGGRHHDAGIGATWTAVSRPPLFTAIGLFPNGSTTYGGGGVFLDDGSLALLSGRHLAAHAPPAWLRLSPWPASMPWQQPPETSKLLRGGWRLLEGAGDWRTTSLWEHPHAREPISLLMFQDSYRGGSGWNTEGTRTYALRRHRDQAEREVPTTTWADWDQRGRLIYTRLGQLFATAPALDAPADRLADFNGQTPDPQPSPYSLDQLRRATGPERRARRHR